MEYNNNLNKMNENSFERNSLINNKSIEFSKNKEKQSEKHIIEKDKEEINRNNILINNSKISTDMH